MTVTGPDFIALQVSDLERSAEFYENALGLRRAPASPPGTVLFTTTPIPFAVREPLPGVDLSEAPRPGLGVALWLHCDTVRLARGLRNSNPGRSCSQPLRPDVHLRRSGRLRHYRSREGVVTRTDHAGEWPVEPQPPAGHSPACRLSPTRRERRTAH